MVNPLNPYQKSIMFKKILVATDGSDLSEKSAKAAIQFAAKNNASIVTIAIIHPISALAISESMDAEVVENVDNLQDELLRNNAEKIKALANKADVRCEIIISRADHAYEEILEAAKKKRCDLIWMASRSRTSLQKLLLGSQTQRVLSHTAIPVLVWQKNTWD